MSSKSLLSQALEQGLAFGAHLWDTFWRIIGALFHLPTFSRPVSKDWERKQTRALYDEVEALWVTVVSNDPDRETFVADLVLELYDRLAPREPRYLQDAIIDATIRLLIQERIWNLPLVDWRGTLSIEEGFEIRKFLNTQKRFLENYDRYIDIWREKVLCIFVSILEHLPHHEESDALEEDVSAFTTHLIDCTEDPAHIIETIMVMLCTDDVVNTKLFDGLRRHIQHNAMVVSGLDPTNSDHTRKPIRFPRELTDKTPTELAERYLQGTPFGYLLLYQTTLSIPISSRFEHCHIVGGTGHGKTQLLERLIYEDLMAAKNGKRGVCVIDSQGDLLNTISHLACFTETLADKLIIIDPNDIEYPVALNMFDMNLDRLGELSGVERERMINATIELYEYMFGALLGAELTGKQGLIFKYLARIMMVIPGATVHTLRALMEDSEAFRPYVAQLHGTAKAFFETQFFSPQFAATKKQILARLWGVLSNPTFERMFSHERNKVDMFAAMQDGKIVLINTAKDLLQKDGSQILGRFFIALIMQATLQRATIPAEDRCPSFVYIDEAHEYFDDHIGDLVNQARKYRVGLTLAHQNLDQLSNKLRADVLSSTSVKLAGGVSAKDAAILSKEMHTTPEFIQKTRKRATTTEFACWIKHVTPHPVHLSFPLGMVGRLPVMEDEDFDAIVAKNRQRYSGEPSFGTGLPETSPEPTPSTQPDPTPTPTPHVPVAEETVITTRDTPPPQEKPRPQVTPKEKPVLGRGGKQHKYLQGLIKKLAEERGYRSTIEQKITGGSVDVSLEKDNKRIACEISVTTSPEHELGNIQKCLAADYDTVIVLTSETKHLRKLKQHAQDKLSAKEIEKVQFFLPDDFVAFIEEEEAESQGSEQTVKGYKVKVKYSTLDKTEQKARRQSIATVILQSMKRMGKDS